MPGSSGATDPIRVGAAAAADDAATVDLRGRCFGGSYLLVEPIGHGATGAVWRAVDRTTGDQVAVKLLREDLMQRPKMIARFVQEHALLLRLRHRHIVGVRDLLSVGESLALVMDLVSGGSLREHLTRHGTLAPAEAAELVRQIAGALAEAHKRGVVHRDVKPDNVLLERRGDDLEVRLTDFGIARASRAPSLTTPHALLGTPTYMAPEVIQGQPASPAADVYALGVVFYELLVGRPPFRGGPALAVLRRHLDTVAARPDGLPTAAWSAVQTCMDKDPDRRPDAALLVRTFTRLADSLAGVAALPPPAPADTEGDTPAPFPAALSVAPDGHHRHPGRRNRPGTWRWIRMGPVVVLAVATLLTGTLADPLRFLGRTAAPAQPPVASPAAPPTASPAATAPPTGAPTPPDRTESLHTPVSLETQPSAAGTGLVRALVPSRPADVRAEVIPFGPWQCAEGLNWDPGHPLLSTPCHATGPGIRVMSNVQALPSVRTDITIWLENAATGRTAAGPYTCTSMAFTEKRQQRDCGPFDVEAPRGHRYVVVTQWRYSDRELLPGGSTRGSEFHW